jgi:hypothetical protein
MPNSGVLSYLNSLFTSSKGGLSAQGSLGSNGVGSNSDLCSGASALAYAVIGESGFSPNFGNLPPFLNLGPSDHAQTTTSTSGAAGSSNTATTTNTSSLPASTLVGAPGGLQFDLVWDASASSAPAGFTSAAIAAATYYTRMFSNPELITIDVGYGEAGGVAIGAGNVSQSQTNTMYATYASVRSALLGDSSSSSYQAHADSTLPATDPLPGFLFSVATAEAKAIGLRPANGTTVDGAVGLSSVLPMDYDSPTNPVGSGQYDAIGAFEHEISEVMGRIGSVGQGRGSNIYTPLDLFRYASPGVRDSVFNETGAYFSIDGGVTNLGVYNNPATGADAGDWAKNVVGDSYGWARPGMSETVSPTDLVEDATLGYKFAQAGLAATIKLGLT